MHDASMEASPVGDSFEDNTVGDSEDSSTVFVGLQEFALGPSEDVHCYCVRLCSMLAALQYTMDFNGRYCPSLTLKITYSDL